MVSASSALLTSPGNGLEGRTLLGVAGLALEPAVVGHLDLVDRRSPQPIIRDLGLLRPIYAHPAAYGHFGRTDVGLPWEQLNKVDDLKYAV